MKTIVQGHKYVPPLYRFDFACPWCHSVYRFEEGDPAPLDDNDDQRDGYSIQINCPTCGEIRWLQQRGR